MSSVFLNLVADPVRSRISPIEVLLYYVKSSRAITALKCSVLTIFGEFQYNSGRYQLVHLLQTSNIRNFDMLHSYNKKMLLFFSCTILHLVSNIRPHGRV